MFKVALSKGRHALIDDSDVSRVLELKWYCSNYGYAVRTEVVKGVKSMVWLHRFIMNCPKGMEVDHINGDPLDNRKGNLRVCTKKQNTKNKTIAKNNTSGYKGVSFAKTRGKYRAYIVNNDKQFHLGYFNDVKDAAMAYNEKALELFGEFAKINDIK